MFGFLFLHCQTLDEMKLEIKPIKIDRRLTGSSFIDEPLQQVCLSLCRTSVIKISKALTVVALFAV